MKIQSITVAAIVGVILLCALSTGGQQQKNQQAPSTSGEPRTSRKGKATVKQPGFTPVPQQWRMPDGRVVEFPASTSKEEIDALAKRMAEGVGELPPGARVVGWESVEGATSLLPEYEQRVATIPTTKSKVDALANAAGVLQRQIIVLQIKLDAERAANDAGFKSTDKTLNNHADSLNVHAAVLANLANDVSRLTIKTNELDDFKRELDKFKEAACPILRAANVGWRTRMELDSACGLH